MQCPYDKQGMRTITVGDATIDACDQCGGVWLDQEELKKIAEVFAWAVPGEPEKFATIIRMNDIPDDSRKSHPPYGDGVVCPVDWNTTERFVYAGDSRIVVDHCPTCSGTWLDGDELVLMAEYLKPKARDLMGKLMIQEMKSTEKMYQELRELTLLPLKLAGAFSSPLAFIATVLSLLVKYGALDITDKYDGFYRQQLNRE